MTGVISAVISVINNVNPVYKGGAHNAYQATSLITSITIVSLYAVINWLWAVRSVMMEIHFLAMVVLFADLNAHKDAITALIKFAWNVKSAFLCNYQTFALGSMLWCWIHILTANQVNTLASFLIGVLAHVAIAKWHLKKSAMINLLIIVGTTNLIAKLTVMFALKAVACLANRILH